MILRLSFLAFFLCIHAYCVEVVVAKEVIKFEEKIEINKVQLKNLDNLSKNCVPLKVNEIESESYLASHHINKNSIICEKDVKKYGNESVVFNFGGVVIEKKGKIIYENSEFIRIKNVDGTIEQIYKDGRTK